VSEIHSGIFIKNRLMISIKIPGQETIHAKHLVLDYNGTLAIDGMLIPGVKEKLNLLANQISIHVITADTFGKAAESLQEIKCTCIVPKAENMKEKKLQFITELGAENTIAIGNGFNDALMLENATIGIALIQKEGASLKTILNADIICTDINDALELLLNPMRVTATLRN